MEGVHHAHVDGDAEALAVGVLESAVRLAEARCAGGGGAALVPALRKFALRLGDAAARAEAANRGGGPRGPRKSGVPGMDAVEQATAAAAAAASALLDESPELRKALRKRRRFVARWTGAWRRHRAAVEFVMGLATVGKLASLTASYHPDGTAATWYLRRVDWGANAVFSLEIVARLVLRNTAADRVWCLVVCPWAAAYWGLLYAEARAKGHGVSVDRDETTKTAFLLLDTFTGLSVFRLRVMQKQIVPIARALPVILYPGLVLALGLWLWSAIGFIAFERDHPAYFGTFAESFFTMWSFLTDSAGGEMAKRLTHTCEGIPWGYSASSGDDEYALRYETTIHSFSEGEDTDDLVNCAPLWLEMVFFYSFEVVMTFLVLNVLLGVVVDAVATARADIVDAEYVGDEGGDAATGADGRARRPAANGGHRRQTGRKKASDARRASARAAEPAGDAEDAEVADDGKDAARVAPAEYTPVTPLEPAEPEPKPEPDRARRSAAQPVPKGQRVTVDPGVNAGRRETTHAPLDAAFY